MLYIIDCYGTKGILNRGRYTNPGTTWYPKRVALYASPAPCYLGLNPVLIYRYVYACTKR